MLRVQMAQKDSDVAPLQILDAYLFWWLPLTLKEYDVKPKPSVSL
jgi:hypothetical protein